MHMFLTIYRPSTCKSIASHRCLCGGTDRKSLGEEEYNTELVLDVDVDDSDRLEEAERRRRDKELVMPSYHEEKGKGKGKKRVGLILGLLLG